MAARTKAKPRARLMESDTEEALRRRGTELLGLILILVGALAWIIIQTYSPDDPSLFSATDAAPRNALGLIGASIADPLHRALGWAAFGIPVALGVWGLRLVTHRGENRAVSRSILTPVALLAAAAFAAAHVPPAGWVHDYGLGGLLGDASLSTILSILPFETPLALAIATLSLAALFTFTTAFALGVTWDEFKGFLRFVRDGSITVYAALLALTGRLFSGAAQGARQAREKAAEARMRRAETQAAKPDATPGGIPRFNPSALMTPSKPAPAAQTATGGGGEDSLMNRITAAVRARNEMTAYAPRTGLREAPPLTASAMDGDLDVLERDDDPLPVSAQAPAARVQHPAAKRPAKSARARTEEEPELELDEDAVRRLQDPAPLAAGEPGQHRPPPPLERGARGERPDARDRARRLRRARRDRLDPPRPGRDHVRAGARRRPQGVPRHRPRRRHRPLDVRTRLPRLDHPRPLGHRHRASQRAARKGPPARDPRRQILRRQRPRPAARARQGHRRRARRGQPRPHAASPDRRHHRIGQIRRHQHHDPVAALPAHARRVPPDHDRPQDAGALRL